MLKSLMYISKSNLGVDRVDQPVALIVAVSNERNVVRGVTGALVFTGEHFVQALEGEEAALNSLMSTLKQDPRHCDVEIVQQGALSHRRFGNWSMAYVGPSEFVTRHIRRLLGDPSAGEARRAADWLETLLVDTARSTHAG